MHLSLKLGSLLFVAGSLSLLATLFFLVTMAAGCGETVPGACLGYVDAAGNCVPKCDPAKCAPGNVCVDNQCRLQCVSHGECFPGTQDCTPAIEDDTERNVQVCLENGRLPLFTNGFPVGNYGLLCANGDVDCALQFACPNGLQCNPTPTCTCEPDAAACEGKALCNVGKCAEDGVTLCTVNTCAANECKPMRCISEVAQGDAASYCSAVDCTDTSECQAGFYCGVKRDPHDICGRTCNGGSCSHDPNISCTTDSNCQKGNNAACGITAEPCMDPAQFDANAGTFHEGGRCLLQNACLRRDQCAPCAHNLDCSVGDGDACTVHAGQNVCARFCIDGLDCLRDEVCLPYAGASGATATCAGAPSIDCTDPALDCPNPDDLCAPRNVCVPAAGACDASDASDKFCAHCVHDDQCGDTGAWNCDTVNGLEKACFNRDFDIPCTVDGDCPTAPNGSKTGTCLDERFGVEPTDSNYHTCYFPFDDGGTADTIDDRFSCF